MQDAVDQARDEHGGVLTVAMGPDGGLGWGLGLKGLVLDCRHAALLCSRLGVQGDARANLVFCSPVLMCMC